VEQTMVAQILPVAALPMADQLTAETAEVLMAETAAASLVAARPDALLVAPAKYPQEKTE